MSMINQHIGNPVSRYDGREKVTGKAAYAADRQVPGLAFGVVVSSQIAAGRITALHIDKAVSVPACSQCSHI